VTFHDFKFNERLTEGIESMGYNEPTPIQQLTIPLILDGKDLIACAQTGTGKTASYLLPVINMIGKHDTGHQITALILVPTRELAQQIDQNCEGLAYFTGISSAAIFGGGDGSVYEQQRRAIQNNVDIIIATPGRLIAHLQSGLLKFKHLKYLVLDEADRMLDMGFQDDIMKIVSHLPSKRQTIMFSATMPDRIRKLAKTILHHPEQVNIAISQPASGIDQQIYRVFDPQKTPLLKLLLKDKNYTSTIIFASTKVKVKELARELKAAKMHVKEFHSDHEQSERESILLDFKNRKLPVIIGTDALSRGIDIEGIDLVVNYDVPPDPEDYIHRIGRTARAATTGTAITLVNERDERRLKRIEQLIGRPIEAKPLPEELGEAPVPKTTDQKHRSQKPRGKQRDKQKNFKRRNFRKKGNEKSGD